MTIKPIVPVSVIIPCYRCSSTIHRAVQSIIEQSQQPAEIILVDDASGDNTLHILAEIETQYPDLVKVIALSKNVGAGGARNVGWSMASQSFVAFLDSDDAWHPKKIEVQYNFMRTNPEVILTGHGFRQLTDGNQCLDWDVSRVSEQIITKYKLMVSNKFVTPSVMLQREISVRFNEGQRHMEDHMLWMSILFEGGCIVKLSSELVAIYKQSYGVSGLSSQLWLMEVGDLGNYLRLYKYKYINVLQLSGFLLFSILKYIRRLVIYWCFLRWQR
ncbi:MAG: glycosyltransferase family 2 protein [Methylococcales bacterium]|nr:glycosyltransferase family 2 protein [Methylococcales bacterium]